MAHSRGCWTLGAVLLVIILGNPALTPAARAQSHYKTLHQFKAGSGGARPYGGLIMDQAGNLYGPTTLGGAANLGTAFELTPGANGKWTEYVLYSFTKGNDGISPQSSLIFDLAGNLYGTTGFGGAHGLGTAFKLTPGANGKWTEHVLHSFTGGNDGGVPWGPLVLDQVGNLYGTTTNGGAAKIGTVFELTPGANDQWTEHVLHRFTGRNDGAGPLAPVIFDRVGSLYGTTFQGGRGGWGVVFKLTPQADGSWKEKVLHSFRGSGDGGPTAAPLTFDQTGNLYGTTFQGGRGGWGVVFKLTPNSNGRWHETVLHTFQDHPGALPQAGVILDALGNLYGTTSGDNSATAGSVFEITP
jgi:uncharacterized repeat protein (TIGR03803 family)